MDSILIVDDDIKLCATLSEDLNEIGYYTHFVTNVDDALEYITTSNVNLILLDLKMPEKDGFYLLTHLKKMNSDIKIIVLTANADVESALKAAQLGVHDYILKPFKFDKLLLTTRKVLQKEFV
ncbi:MAG: response regulator [Melioribacteraceae bacterium]|nr:response regulator [Melioribacteraceae bacterium]